MRGNGAPLVFPELIKGVMMTRIDVIDIGNPGVSGADDIVEEFGIPFAVSCHEDMRESVPFNVREWAKWKVSQTRANIQGKSVSIIGLDELSPTWEFT